MSRKFTLQKSKFILSSSFVGELYLRKLLSMNIMSACMRQLVSSDNENELESLSKLIPTIGREFEREYNVSFFFYQTKD